MSQPEALREGTKQFALRIFKLFRSLPKSDEGRVLGNRVLPSGTSIAANYRAICPTRSKAQFITKMGTVVEEADETVFWLELLAVTGLVPHARMPSLLTEDNELVAIFVASRKTAKAN